MDFSNTVIQILLFVIFLLILLFINKFFLNKSSIKSNNINKINNINSNNISEKEVILEKNNNVINCKNDETEDPLINNNKNDLKIVNNKIKMYGDDNNDYDLINELLPKHKEHKIPSKELDKHFMNNNIIYKPEISKCNIKEYKTDLPIVNIMACNLTKNSYMKLSEYI